MNKSFKTLFTISLGILFFILTFTANSTANAKVVEVCEQDTPNGVAFIKFFSNSEQYDNREHSFTELERRVWGTILECTLVRKSNNEELYLKILKKSKRWILYGTGEDRGIYFTHSIKNKSFQKLWKRYAVINPTTYIAKERKKLTQTQQVAEKKITKNIIYYNCKYKATDTSLNFSLDRHNKVVKIGHSKKKIIYDDNTVIIFDFDGYAYRHLNIITGDLWTNAGSTEKRIIGKLKKKRPPVAAKCNPSKDYDIAKKEPTQTQQIAKKEKKKEVEVAKKKQDLKCVLFNICEPTQTQQVAKKKEPLDVEEMLGQTQQVANLKSKEKKTRSSKVNKDQAKILLEKKLAKIKAIKDPKLKAEKEKRIEEAKKVEAVRKVEKEQTEMDKFKAFFIKPKDKIVMEEVVKLASYQPIKEIPEGMIKKLGKACKVLSCQSKKAGQYVYKVFVRGTKMGQQRNPGNMIYGMAMYEIMYLQKLRKAEKSIKRYINKGGPEGYTSAQWTFKSSDEGKIRSVVRMNKGRKKMRAALGMDINLPIETVLKRYWLLGDFLNEGKIKVKKAKLDPAIKKRKALLVEYRTALNKLKKKIEENENL